MICFEAHVNDKRLCLAGVGATGVLTAILTWVNRERHEADEVSDPQATHIEELFFRVSGLTDHGNDSVHLVWGKEEQLKPGDEIRIRIVERDLSDPPISAHTDTADFVEKSKRAYYEQLKQEYEGNAGSVPE